MRTLYLFDMITLNGFFEGPNREIDWHTVDDEFNDFAVNQLNATDLLLFGRVTYDLMAGFWPTPEAQSSDPIVAQKMNSMSKIVFSRTMDHAAWNNTKLIKTDVPEEVLKLKKQTGKDIGIFGSSNLATSLIQSRLIDEYRIIVNPVVLGNGAPIFKGIQAKLNLRLKGVKAFRSGNVLLSYQPQR